MHKSKKKERERVAEWMEDGEREKGWKKKIERKWQRKRVTNTDKEGVRKGDK